MNSSLEPMSTLVPKSKEILQIIGQGVEEGQELGDHVILHNNLIPDSNGDIGMEEGLYGFQKNEIGSDSMNNSIHNCHQYLDTVHQSASDSMMLSPPIENNYVPWCNDPLELAPTHFGLVEWTNPQSAKVS